MHLIVIFYDAFEEVLKVSLIHIPCISTDKLNLKEGSLDAEGRIARYLKIFDDL